MSWIILATLAQIIQAVVALLDKYIVSDEKVMPRPFVYAFYTCLFGGVWLVVFLLGLIPVSLPGFSVPSLANVDKPTLEVVALSFLAAYTFFIALVSMFTALQRADASDVVPVIGAISAVGSFILGYFFLESLLSPNYIWGILLLATGTLLVSRLRFPEGVTMLTIHGGLFFALHWVVIKGLFDVTTFDNGFFWSRVAFVFLALTLLLVPSYWGKITEQTKKTSKRAGSIVIANKVLAGVATIMLLKATDMGSVEVVQALGGLQFVFIFLFGLLFFKFLPDSFGEADTQKGNAFQKAVFVSIITLGFIMLFL